MAIGSAFMTGLACLCSAVNHPNYYRLLNATEKSHLSEIQTIVINLRLLEQEN